MSENNEQSTATETPSASTTQFVKIERDQFDAVLSLGSRESINRLASMDTESLRRAERYAEDRRREKGANTYLTFPVRKEKQQAAGRLYLQALTAFRTAVRAELAKRVQTMFDAPAPAVTETPSEEPAEAALV